MFSVFFRTTKSRTALFCLLSISFLHKPHQRRGMREYCVLVSYHIAKSLTLYALVWGSLSLTPRKVCSHGKRGTRDQRRLEAF